MLYLDHAATSPLLPEVLDVMLPFLCENFHNPSSVYKPARMVRATIDEARQKIAAVVNAAPDELFFTSGGTEATNWAIKGVLAATGKRHIVTAQTEHHAVLYVCRHLEKNGYTVTYLPVCGEGFVNPADLEKAIRPGETAVVAIMLANNEVGTIQPIAGLSEIASRHGVPFLTDAVQAVGHIPVDVEDLGVQMLALSAHKFGGPKGVGALFVKKGTPMYSLLQGGAQERNRRAGTENVAGIVGMGAALEISARDMAMSKIPTIRDELIRRISTEIPHVKLNGATGASRLPGNVNFSFRFIEGEALLYNLDLQGCFVSTGSACSSAALEPSHVLMALNIGHELANGAIRFSLGTGNTPKDIDRVMEILTPAVEKLRNLSPLYDDFLKGEK